MKDADLDISIQKEAKAEYIVGRVRYSTNVSRTASDAPGRHGRKSFVSSAEGTNNFRTMVPLNRGKQFTSLPDR
jgi:hypothetical protein